MPLFIFILTSLGFIDSLYLSLNIPRGRKVVCFVGRNCNIVLASQYAYLFGIRTIYIGLAFYALTSFIALTILFSGIRLWLIPIGFFAGLATLVSIYLVWVQAKILRQWCAHCLFGALLNVIILGGVVFTLI